MPKNIYKIFGYRTLPDIKTQPIVDYSVLFNTYIKNIRNVPIVSEHAGKAISLLSDSNSDIEMIEQVVAKDQTIAIALIKAANFGFKSNAVSTIEQALVRVGMSRALGIILSYATMAKLPHNIRQPLYEHSLMTGILAKNLAKNLREDQELLYTAGLIHDIGLAIMVIFLLNQSLPVYIPGNLQQERIMFGMDHGEAGAIYLKNTAFPQDIIEIVRSHTKISPEESTNYRKMISVVQLADMLANVNGNSMEAIYSQESISSKVSELLLSEDDIVDLTKESFRDVKF